jgi:photosystem II stability/assembly factor-like uncharacterized protein
MKMLMALLICGMWVCDAAAQRDLGSWKKPLHDKALHFERNTAERHNILGTYPSSVRLVPPRHFVDSALGGWRSLTETGELPPGWTFDHGATGPSNIAHTSSWTACLLTGEAFHVAFLRDSLGTDHPDFKKAYDRANEIIAGFRILTLVSGQPGFLARGITFGHGVSYEERAGADTRDLWKQGKGEYQHLRYRGGPSHHNYDQVFRGLGLYYFVAADDAQKDAIREIVRDMSNWAHLKNDMRVMHDDGKRESTVLIGGWRGMDGSEEPSGGSLMATTGLKIAYTITGNEKVKALYEKWVDHLGYRDPERTKKSIMGGPRRNYDDTDHLLGDLYVLNLIEKDDDLRRFYTKCVRDSWEAHKDEKLAWFNYVYGAVLGEEFSDPEGSVWNLQTFPTCRIFQPQMNSIRTDIEFFEREGRKEALHPLPVHERRSDNEYEYKGSPYALDGWTSRIVSEVEVSPIDSYVQFAADTSGAAYRSLTKGELWHGMKGLPRVNDFLFSPDYPWLAFAATTGGVYRTRDGGVSWGRVFDTPVDRLKLDPENTHVVYAVGVKGVFKSMDLDEREMGVVWKAMTDPGLAGKGVFAVDPRGDATMLYRLTEQGVYTRQEGDADWRSPERLARSRGFGSFSAIGGKPEWLRVDDTTPGRLFRGVAIPFRSARSSFVSVSDDDGVTWRPVLQELAPLVAWASSTGDTIDLAHGDLMRLMGLFAQFSIRDICVDRADPQRWYGLMDSAVAVTEDAGKSWHLSTEGLHIPQVHTLCAPRDATDVYVGTPAGLYVSRDHGKTWQDTTLVPQYEGAEREEIGGAGYITAYWMGRYHGFIGEQTAMAKWWK